MKFKRIISFVLAAASAFALVGCNKGDNGESGGKTDDAYVNPTSDYAPHYVEGTLHKIKLSETGRAFVVNGKTDYVIVAGDDAAINTAASFISKQVGSSTGAKLPVISEGEEGASAKRIYIGCDNAFEKSGLKMPDNDLGKTGYYIKNVGDNVYIKAASTEAYQLAAIAFCREVLGYDMISEDCVVFEKSGAVLPDIEVIERPDIDYRLPGSQFGMSTSEAYGMGFTPRRVFMPIKDVTGQNAPSEFHNILNILPPSIYMEEHPDWYSVDGGELQFCYTAHGNYEEYQLMLETIAEKLFETILEEPTFDTVNIGQSDAPNCCACDYCNGCVERYGAISSTLVMCIDDIDDLLQKKLEDYAAETGTEKRTMHITFFAYHATQEAPVIKNDDGTYSAYIADWNSRFDPSFELPEERRELKCNDTVGVLCAPIEAFHSHTFYEPINVLSYDLINGWGELTDYLCMWMYSALYHDDYFFPLNVFDTMAENYRFVKANDTHVVFYQGIIQNQVNPGFYSLKKYIESKMGIDVNTRTQDIVDKFFKYYFGAAGDTMREFYSELQSHMTYLETAFPGGVTGSSYDSLVSRPAHWPYGLARTWLDLIDKAYGEIEYLKATDRAAYDVYYKNINVESLLPRWIILKCYSGYLSKDELTAMRRQFIDDCVNYGVANQTEADQFDFSSWE